MAQTEAAEPAVPQASGKSSPFASLAHRPFRWWFLSQILSASGGMTQVVAAAWLVLGMTDSAVALGALAAVSMLPSLVWGAYGGVVADHLDRRRLLIATQCVLGLLSVALWALVVTDTATYWWILGISAAAGLVNAIDGPARQVYVLDLVGRERLASAVSLYEVILNTSRVLGPATGGALLLVWGPAACILLSALSFVAPLWVLISHGRSASTTPERPRAERPRRGATASGLRYAWSIPSIRACLLLAAVSGILFNTSVLLPLFTTRVFDVGPAGYGALLATFGIGAVPGALVAARGDAPRGRQVALLAAATGAATVATALAPFVVWLFIGMAAVGFTSIWMVARANTLVQLRADPDFRGRVMGAWTMALPGMNPVTGIAMGVLAEVADARIALTTAGALLLTVAATSWRAFGR